MGVTLSRRRCEELVAEVARTTRFFAPPKGRLGARATDPAFLERHGLPPEPAPELPRTVHAVWKRLLAPSLTFEKAGFSAGGWLPGSSHGGSATTEASENWSGAYVKPKRGEMITELYGIWRVPKPRPRRNGPADLEYRSSTWIGVDGQRRYYHSSLPQIGTAQFVANAVGRPQRPKVFAWWQWWLSDHSSPPVDLSLPVAVGDTIGAHLRVVRRDRVRFFIANLTRKVALAAFECPAPPRDVPLEVSGATAAWITERPSELDGGPLYVLPDCGSVRFEACLALSSAAPGAPPRTLHTLTGATFIDMYERRARPYRTHRVSRARRDGESELTTDFA
jgi:hypothetical protein